MNSKIARVLAALCVAGACTAARAAKVTQKADVPLDDVPQPVLDAAAKAIKGISLTEAKLRSKKSGVVFKLAGVAAGKAYDLKVDAAGRVLEIEHEGNAANVEHGDRANRPDKVRA